MKKKYSIKEAAEALKANPETLRRWDKSVKFKSLRHPVNHYREYSEQQVAGMVEELQLELNYAFRLSRDTHPRTFIQTVLGRLYNQDAQHLLHQLESDSVDLIFTAPRLTILKKWNEILLQIKSRM